MKTILNCLFFLLITNFCLAQKPKYEIVDKDGNLMNYNVGSLRSKINMILQVDSKTKSINPFNQLPNDSLGTIVYLEDAPKALLTVRLKKDSLQYYRYSIVEDDNKVLVKDAIPSKVNFFWNERSSWPGYLTMDLGISNIVNKKLTVKIYRLPESNLVTTLVLYNKPLKPAKIVDVILSAPSGNKNQPIALLPDTSINVDEKTKGIYISMKTTDLDFVYSVHIIHTPVNDAHNVGFMAFIPRWSYNSLDRNPYTFIDVNYFNKPGTYKVYITPQTSSTVEMPSVFNSKPQFTFHVSAVPKAYQLSDVIRIGLFILVAVAIVAGLIVFVIKRKNLGKLKVAQKKADSAKGELDHIRSQLNPHFVYNALSGIQNLINKNEVQNANSYLSKFARLTRNVLNENDLISIQDECSLLDDYLAMERLRFHFDYSVNTDDLTNLQQVEIPTMLLQPFAENAVKHSMSLLQDKGILTIAFQSVGKNLLVSIKDNGKGFDVSRDHEGLGLMLCKKRIDLLNQVYAECPITLNIKSGNSGTDVFITLNNWL